MSIPSWFAGRSVFRVRKKEDGREKTIFEERIILVWATEFEEACAKVKAEAKAYQNANPGSELLDHIVVYCAQEEQIADGVEIWSILREADLSAADYVDHYHGAERESVLVYKC